MKKRIVTTAIGCILLPLGIATLIYYNKGVSSFDMFILVVSSLINQTYIVTLRLFQSLVLVLIIILKFTMKSKPKITWPDIFMPVLTVVIVTVLIDVFLSQVNVVASDKPVWIFILGIFSYIYGITMLVRGNILLAPNDKILVIAEQHTTHTYALYKVIIDTIMLIFSVICVYKFNYDYSITVLTVVLTFLTGTGVGIFTKLNRVLFKL